MGIRPRAFCDSRPPLPPRAAHLVDGPTISGTYSGLALPFHSLEVGSAWALRSELVSVVTSFLRLLASGLGLASVFWRWFRFILFYRSFVLGVCLGVVVGGGFVLLYRSFALGVGFGRSAFAAVSYFIPSSSFALGVVSFVPLSRWFRIFYPVLRSR